MGRGGGVVSIDWPLCQGSTASTATLQSGLDSHKLQQCYPNKREGKEEERLESGDVKQLCRSAQCISAVGTFLDLPRRPPTGRPIGTPFSPTGVGSSFLSSFLFLISPLSFGLLGQHT